MKFDAVGQMILDHSLCLKCQFEKGNPFVCPNCQWSLVMNWIYEKEEKNRQYKKELEIES